MSTLPLQVRDGHVFIELGGALWLMDTGARTSFGSQPSVAIAGETFNLESGFLGLTPLTLSQFVGVPCAGLLGGDVLGGFDHILDAAGGRVTISASELSHTGDSIALDEFLGIPVVTARIGGGDYRMVFDTGAQISYFQDESLGEFPPAGSVADFYPGLGQFQTATHLVATSLGGVTFALRCGTLPDLLGVSLMAAGISGIIGNEILGGRTVGYFPRRHLMSLGPHKVAT